MKLDYDVQKINSILETFYVLTKANICVFDSDFNVISAFGEMPKYCKAIRKNAELYHGCMLSDREHARQCFEQKKSVTYTCHAGVMETISPIFLDGVLLGYVIFGGLKDGENEFSNSETVRKSCEKYGLPYEEYLADFDGLSSFTHVQLDAYIKVLNICVEIILSENLLKPSCEVFSCKVVNFIKENFKEYYSVADYCERFGISEKTLYRIVKDYSGKTVNEFITGLKIDRAKELLLSTETSVSSVAAEVGFNDYNYFIKVFRKSEGTTPLKFRKMKSGRDVSTTLSLRST